MSEIVYVIPGNPIALARPRLCQHGVYDSQRHDKLIAGLNLRSQHGNNPLYASQPIHLEATFFMHMPESARKRWPLMVGKPHIYKPDIDNLEKWILDISNHVIFEDDCIVASISAKKIYDDNPRTEFIIRRLS